MKQKGDAGGGRILIKKKGDEVYAVQKHPTVNVMPRENFLNNISRLAFKFGYCENVLSTFNWQKIGVGGWGWG